MATFKWSTLSNNQTILFASGTFETPDDLFFDDVGINAADVLVSETATGLTFVAAGKTVKVDGLNIWQIENENEPFGKNVHFLNGSLLLVGNNSYFGGDSSFFDDLANTIPSSFSAGAAKGNDQFYGLGGDDTLEGGAGNDLLNGGSGADTASYETALAGVVIDLALAVSQNTVGAGIDTLVSIENVTGSVFDDHLSGSAGDNVIDGGAGFDEVSYATATAAVTVNLSVSTAQDTGAAGADTLIDIENVSGSAFDDSFTGNDGNNRLVGDLGNDVLDGGAGIDTASYEDAAAGVTVNLSTVGQQNTVSAGLDTLLNIENLIGSDFNDTLSGDSANNLFVGGAGDDVVDGDLGFDTVSYADAAAGVRVDLSIAVLQNTLGAGSDVLTAIEGLVGSTFNDTLAGNAADNTLSGGTGDDVLLGGLGDDTLIGGAGEDTASYATATTGVTVNLGLGVQQDTSGAGLDRLSGCENVMGSNFADRLTGNALVNTIIGGLGNDTLSGGAGEDTASYATAITGVTVSLGLVVRQDTVGAGLDMLADFENLIGSNFADRLTGNALANTITGGLGNDTLSGGAGVDTASYATAITGVTVNLGLATRQNTVGAGLDMLAGFENLTGSRSNDKLTGNAANNVLLGGLGNDVLDGKSGSDTASYDDAANEVKVNLTLTGSQNTLGAGQDTLVSIENLIGSAFNDVLTGNGLNNTLTGGFGNDKLIGGGGVDTASYANIASGVDVSLATTAAQNTGGAGVDTLVGIENLVGGSGSDGLFGNAGNNVLFGGAGDDFLFADAGRDVLDGGRGIDYASYSGISASVTVSLAITGPQNTGGAASIPYGT